MGDQPSIPLDELANAQRARCRALAVACLLLPEATFDFRARVARWIITGKWGPDAEP